MAKSSRGKSGRVIDLRGKKGASHIFQASLPFFEKKRSPLKARRRRTRIVTAALALALIGGGAWGLHYASYRPEVTLQSIHIVGVKEISEDSVHAIADGALGSDSFSYISPRNMFLFSRETVERAILDTFPRIAKVSVSRESFLAQAAIVTVEERVPFGLWCLPAGSSAQAGLPAQAGSETCYLLDESGYLFDEVATTSPARASVNKFSSSSARTSESEPSDVPRSTSPVKYRFEGALQNAENPLGQTFLPEHFSSIRALMKKLEQKSFYVSSIRVEDEYDFRMFLDRGYSLRIAFGASPDDVIRNLELILSSDSLRGKEGNLLYVDLRFGNRVYFKFREG